MSFSLCEPPTRETRPQHREHTLFGKCVGFLTSTVNHVTLNMQETGTTAHSHHSLCERPYH